MNSRKASAVDSEVDAFLRATPKRLNRAGEETMFLVSSIPEAIQDSILLI